MKIPFLSPAYQGRSLAVAADRMVNLFPEITYGKNGVQVAALVGAPGTEEFAAVGGAGEEVRGIRVFNSLMYVVVGNKLVSVDAAATVSGTLGTLSSSSGPVSMSDNGLVSAGLGGNQLMIVDGGKTYIYNVSTGVFSSIVKPADSITFLDGYFIENVKDSMSFVVSDAYDGMAWNPLASSPVAGSPDISKAAVNLHQQLWIVKDYSAEIWYNAAVPTSQGSPFLRLPGAVIDFGTVNGASVVVGDNSLFWVAQQKTGTGAGFIGAVEVVNYIPRPITPPSIVYLWRQYARVDDVFGFAYVDEGHTFIVWTFPTANATWVYDATAQMWHERSEYNRAAPYSINRWKGNCYAFYDNRHFIGGWRDGKLYAMSTGYYDDAGVPIIAERVCPTIYDDKTLKKAVVHRLSLDMETGVGNPPADIDPEISLAFSRDFGNTWSSEYPAKIGKLGEYRTRVYWTRLGMADKFTFRLRMSGKHKRVLVNAYAE